MVIKKGKIKHLEHKYSVCWSIFSDFGIFNKEMRKDPLKDFRDNGDDSFTRIKGFKPIMTEEEVEERQKKMDEEWVVDNNSEEKDGKYFLKVTWEEVFYSNTEMVIRNGKIDIESCLKAYDEILKKQDNKTIHYIESFKKSEAIRSKKEHLNGKKCIEVFAGT